jgi:hypothetical protein
MVFVSSFRPAHAVSQTGARPGCILGGATKSNRGLRLRVLQDQARGSDGPIVGAFHILNVGDNQHSESLGTLLGQVTDAEKVACAIRRAHPQCINIVNANILILEAESAGCALAVLPKPSH